MLLFYFFFFFFFNDTATTEIYTLSLHDALPILLLIAARLAGYRGPRAVRMGCVVELLHTATLIHDDVVDRAPLRRGRPSANARWGDDASILVGDHPSWKSFALMVEDG